MEPTQKDWDAAKEAQSRALKADIAKETRLKLVRLLGWREKPNWNDLPQSAVDPKLLEDLEQFTADELGIHNNLLATLQLPTEQFFLVSRNGVLYLADRSGYDYVRMIYHIGTIIERRVPVPDTLEYVRQAYRNAGYDDRELEAARDKDRSAFLAATFKGINATGKEIYTVTYKDDDGDELQANIYVWERDGKKVADF